MKLRKMLVLAVWAVKEVSKKLTLLVLLAVAAVACCLPGQAVAFTDGFSTATFTLLNSTTLQVDISQDAYFGTIGGGKVSAANLLTAVFWNAPTTGVAVTGGDAGASVKSGSSVIQFTSTPTALGAEFGFLKDLDLTGTLFAAANQGIGNAGLSGVVPSVSFGPTSLWVPNGDLNPPSPGGDGLDFAFVPTSYNTGDGNPDVTKNPLVQNEMLFTLTVPDGFSLADISNVGFNYGTALNTVPIPPSILLMGSGLLGLAGWRRARKI